MDKIGTISQGRIGMASNFFEAVPAIQDRRSQDDCNKALPRPQSAGRWLACCGGPRMRIALAVALLLLYSLPLQAQQPQAGAQQKERKERQQKNQQPKAIGKKSPRLSPVAESYAAMPAAHRISIQNDLIWTGDYNGTASADFGERAVAAVRAFQKRNATKETGVLNPQERALLAAAAKAKYDAVGWRMVDDAASGARLGIPGKLVPQSSPTKSGTRWTSSRGEVQVETFRLRNVRDLAAAFEEQKKAPPDRKVSYGILRPEFFVVAGLQGLKKVYVRAHLRDGEVRGVTILYDQAMEGTMDPVVVAMSSAFAPFAAQVALPPPPKVQYGTGLVVSIEGHVLADRETTANCHIITLPGHGGADRIAEDKSSELALLRLYGTKTLTPVMLASATPSAGAVTIAGIPDPQIQDGGQAVSVAPAKLAAAPPDNLFVEPTPRLDLGSVLDAQGRLLGLMRRGPSGAPSQESRAAFIPLEKARTFLHANGVPPAAAGGLGLDAVKGALVRVICVRK